MKKLIIMCMGLVVMLSGCFEKKTDKLMLKEKGRKKNQELIEASKAGKAETVEMLLRMGANKDAVDGAGQTALMIASLQGQAEVVELLIKAGANKEAADNVGITALVRASERGHARVVEVLIKGGANKEAVDCEGSTVLMAASERGQSEIVEVLIREGADKDAVDEMGWTALVLASNAGQSKIVEMLIRAGANKDASTKCDTTAFMIASKAEIAGMLIRAGANKDAVDANGQTALHNAIRFARIEVIKFLYSNLANINIKDKSEITPIGRLYYLAIEKKELRSLFISIINHELKILRKLLEKRFNEIRVKTFELLKQYKQSKTAGHKPTLSKKIKKDENHKEEEDGIKALQIIEELNLHLPVVNQIFKDVVEMSTLYRYILENPELKIDETIFEMSLKYEEEKIIKFTSEDIINLYVGSRP